MDADRRQQQRQQREDAEHHHREPLLRDRRAIVCSQRLDGEHRENRIDLVDRPLGGRRQRRRLERGAQQEDAGAGRRL